MHVEFGEYHVRDVEFVAAFDVDAKKVGRDLSEAIVASENNTITFADVPPTGVTVQRGHTFDGLGEYYREIWSTESDETPVDVVKVLKDAEVDVLVCYLPVGSAKRPTASTPSAPSTRTSRSSTRCRCSSPATRYGRKKFADAGVPIVGDDIKSQVGATITHRVLAKLFEDRGVSCCAPTSSTSAATWTSRTCWSASAWSPRRSPRPSRSPRRSRTRCAARRPHRPVGPRAVAR